jgi:hypothetical protein
MSNPMFIHIQTNGDVFASIDPHYVPAGTSLGIYRVNSAAASQKLGTLTATAGAVTGVSGTTGKQGKEIS